MNGSISGWLLGLGASCVVAVLTAWVTVRLSLKRFRAEHWWERKYEAYSRSMEALHDWKCWCQHGIAEETVQGVRGPSEYKRKLSERMNTSAPELSKLMDTGSFILSKEATEELDRFRKREEADWDKEGPLSVYQTELEACSECLERIVPIARKDLGLSK